MKVKTAVTYATYLRTGKRGNICGTVLFVEYFRII